VQRNSHGLPEPTDLRGNLVTHSVPLSQIRTSPRNPRQRLKGIEELAASIEQHGLMQPVVIRRCPDGYELVAGHRRLAAVEGLGWSTVPAVIREADDDEAYVLTLVENLQRDDLSPKEQSRALEILVRERGWSTRQVAEAVRRSPAYVSKRLRVFDDPVLAPLVLTNRLQVSAAEELLTLSPAKKASLARRAVDEGWDTPRMRAVVRGRAIQKSKRGGSIAGLARTLRALLRTKAAAELVQTERRELRLLLADLALMAKAPVEARPMIVPQLPKLVRRR
jgi:ParB family chromosome partitioning protein